VRVFSSFDNHFGYTSETYVISVVPDYESERIFILAHPLVFGSGAASGVPSNPPELKWSFIEKLPEHLSEFGISRAMASDLQTRISERSG